MERLRCRADTLIPVQKRSLGTIPPKTILFLTKNPRTLVLTDAKIVLYATTTYLKNTHNVDVHYNPSSETRVRGPIVRNCTFITVPGLCFGTGQIVDVIQAETWQNTAQWRGGMRPNLSADHRYSESFE